MTTETVRQPIEVEWRDRYDSVLEEMGESVRTAKVGTVAKYTGDSAGDVANRLLAMKGRRR